VFKLSKNVYVKLYDVYVIILYAMFCRYNYLESKNIMLICLHHWIWNFEWDVL